VTRSRPYAVAVLPGDGIGPEVMAEAQATLEAVAERCQFGVAIRSFEAGAQRVLDKGAPMDPGLPDQLSSFDAILCGPFGDPRVHDTIVVWGTILALRQRFDQYVNLRPARVFPGILTPLRDIGPGELDIVVVRENTEGEYGGVGGRVHRGRPGEVAVETSVFTRAGIERVIRYAFDYARARGRTRVTSATKSNALRHAMPFWDEVSAAVAADYPDIEHEAALVDALAARVISDPGSLDVIVASNLFGDILTDITAAASGSLGIAPSANIDPTRTNPSLFQAIHGSAPTIAGKGVANPVAELMSVAMMLDFLGETAAASAIEHAVELAVADPATRTADLGGTAGTKHAGAAVRERLDEALAATAVA
jgi:tartrate dehydrogenase/decarboxylase/D-malate dehydrogenase